MTSSVSLRSLKVLLLHARDANDAMLSHEFECFVARSGLDASQFTRLNLAIDGVTSTALRHVDVVMVGGSGDYSVSKGGFDWHEPMLDLMREIVAQDQPMFASCFGFQALMQALGATIEKAPERAELGTFEMKVTKEGERDVIFGQLPRHFDAQLGHNDSAMTLPEGVVLLAQSQRCPYQAVRVGDAPILATQFHPELTQQDNITRYMRYFEIYRKPGQSMDEGRAEAASLHRPSPHSNRLIRLFLEHVFGD